jgi:hypothetical protein
MKALVIVKVKVAVDPGPRLRKTVAGVLCSITRSSLLTGSVN